MAAIVGVAAITLLLLCIYRWLMKRPVKPPNPPADSAEARGAEDLDALIRGDGESVEGSQELDMGPELQLYDVFLSFRGPDTRQSVTDVLYDYMVMAGLRVFRDDHELAIGDKIDTILDAIQVSEICVPVFSETFPESKWCLREVKRMVDFNKTIVPIFHKVSVDDVKLKTPRYDELMKKHQQTSRKEEVDEWKAALRAATENKGRVLSNQGYSDFCKDFISEVLKRLGPREGVHADDLIGVKDQLTQFGNLLDVGSSGTVQYICVHGMGGIGKTALSKYILNKFSWRFDSWKFIENVREECSVAGGLKKLKKKLIKDIGKSIQGKRKLLLVLDDVDECNQMEELAGQHIGYGAGSVIIVTTREEDILGRCNGLTDGQIIYFEMNCLGYDDALQLFCNKAFDLDTPPDDFKSLSKDVVDITGRLPLSLIVMGSFLRGQNKKMWEQSIERSEKILDKDVKKVLKISYDKLDHDQQQIFLDLACFPICREEPSRMMAMWEACNFYPEYSLSVLESKSLIKILVSNLEDSYKLDYEYRWENYMIWVHDHLLDLGRDIVSGDGKLDLTERSRLWQEDEAYKLLRSQNAHRNKVVALSLRGYRGEEEEEEEVGTLENLRLLDCDSYFWLRYRRFGCDNIFPGLRYLRLSLENSLHINFISLSNLVRLDIINYYSGSNMKGSDINLKGAPNLKELIVDHTGISELPSSIVDLLKLQVLSLKSANIKELPDSIDRLRNLKRLSLYGCRSLKGLPPSIGNLQSLIVLDLRDTAIQVLPEFPPNLHELYLESEMLEKMGDISRLNHLVYLRLVGGYQVATSNLDAIERFTELRSLVLYLDLPEDVVLQINFSGLSHLEILQLSCWNFKDLPLQLPSCLSTLELSHIRSNAQFCSLPPGLNELTLSECSSLILVEGLYLPQSIQNLILDSCISLMEVSIPRELNSLVSLHIRKCISLEKIEGLFELENLEDIQIDNSKVTRDMDEIGTLQARRQGGNLLMGKRACNGEDEEGESDGQIEEDESSGQIEEDESDGQIEEERWRLLWNESLSTIDEVLKTDYLEQATKLGECCDVVLCCFVGRSDHRTGQSFCNVLYGHMVRAGIRVFIPKYDDQNETISEMGDIKSSQLCIPVFSETFASTDDDEDEDEYLLQKVSWMLQFGKAIMPIFYRVSPDVVNDVVMKKLGEEQEIEQWEHALGRKVIYKEEELQQGALEDTTHCDTNFYEELVSDVLKKLEGKAKAKHDLDGLIGVEHQLEHLTKMINLGSDKIQYIVIYGMDSIGKTSLAKELLNRFSPSFDYNIFIGNIRERSLQMDGLYELKNEVDRWFVESYCGRMALLVLDDVDKSEQVEKLVVNNTVLLPDPGSRIIITTSSRRVLKYCELLKGQNVIAFKMQPLKPLDALQLFNRHAFMEVSPVPHLVSLSKEVVNSIGGLPLALIVLGSLLRNEEIEKWKYVIERLKDIPFKQVKEKLKISYESLSHNQKQVFLDMACFPYFWHRPVEVCRMWESSKFYPTYGLAVLESKCLIKRRKDDQIWIHDQLRDMGRDIVSGESNHPWECSRLREHDHGVKALECNGWIKENIQAIFLDEDLNTLRLKMMGSLENLRFLCLRKAKLIGDFHNIFPKLRWLAWDYSFFRLEMNVNFSLSNLETLEMDIRGIEITKDWRGWAMLQGLKNLKDLTLYINSKSTPCFPENMSIERLIIKKACNLTSIHDSIGNLKCLKHLEMKLSYREYFFVQDGISLPESIGELTSLVCLDAENTNISTLPSSISQLSALQKLKLDGCHGLSELPELPISLCEIYVESKFLHKVYDISGLINLVHLKLVSGLTVETTNFEGVEKFSKLKSLVLYMSFQVLTRQVNFSSLSELESLHLSCHNLKDQLQLPPRLSFLSLHFVNSDTRLCSLPSSLKELVLSRWTKKSGYETLGMENLHLLERLGIFKSNFNLMEGLRLPLNIINLVFIECEFLENLPDLSHCVNLNELIVWRCIKLREISISGDLKSFRCLYIGDCISLEKIEGLSELKDAHVFNINNFKDILDKWVRNSIYQDHLSRSFIGYLR